HDRNYQIQDHTRKLRRGSIRHGQHRRIASCLHRRSEILGVGAPQYMIRPMLHLDNKQTSRQAEQIFNNRQYAWMCMCTIIKRFYKVRQLIESVKVQPTRPTQSAVGVGTYGGSKKVNPNDREWPWQRSQPTGEVGAYQWVLQGPAEYNK